MNNFLDEAAHNFMGEESPIKTHDWEKLEKLIAYDEQKYENVVRDESNQTEALKTASVDVFRIKASEKKPKCTETYNLLKTKLTQFMREKTQIDSLFLDRCQAHIYHENNFLGKHRDRDTHDYYRAVALLNFTDPNDYEGGEFVIDHPIKGPRTYKAPAYSVSITSCGFSHGVSKLTKGQRKTICAFFAVPYSGMVEF